MSTLKLPGVLRGPQNLGRKQSPPLLVLCGQVMLPERPILYVAADPWKGREHLCRPE